MEHKAEGGEILKDHMNLRRGMISRFPLKPLVVCSVLITFLFASPGCSYKPSYLVKSEKTPVAERWKVGEIDPSLLSPDEKITWGEKGSPQYIRFFRSLSFERKRVYEWVYTNPVHLLSFIDGKKVAYVVVDDDPSSLNEEQKKWLFWSGVAAGTTAGLGLLYYYLVGSK
jgi:hypothetical protein